MKRVIRLTEEDLHNIIKESVNKIIEEKNINEGWKDWAVAGALGAASLFGNPQTANAQNLNQQQTQQINQNLSKEQIGKLLKQWNRNTKPSMPKEQFQQVLNNFSFNNQDEISKKFLDSILFKSQNGEYISLNRFTRNDIQIILNSLGGDANTRVGIFEIDGVKYFININNTFDWDF